MESKFLLLPPEVKELIFTFLPLSALAKLARTVKGMQALTMENPVLLNRMFFQADSLDSEDRDTMLWDSYYYLKPDVQRIHPLHSVIQEFKMVLNRMDQVGASAMRALEAEEADILSIKKAFYESIVHLLEQLMPFLGYRGNMLLFHIRNSKETISNSITSSDTPHSARDCIETIKSLLERVKSVYLRDTIRNQDKDNLNIRFFGAIALSPEWHQLVLDDSTLQWERVVKSQTQKTQALILRLLEQPAFQAFIGDNTAKLLSFIKLPLQSFPKGPAIALKIYDYCVNHYGSDIQKEVFDHYDVLYPEVFKHLKAPSFSNDLELAQSMAVQSLG